MVVIRKIIILLGVVNIIIIIIIDWTRTRAAKWYFTCSKQNASKRGRPVDDGHCWAACVSARLAFNLTTIDDRGGSDGTGANCVRRLSRISHDGRRPLLSNVRVRVACGARRQVRVWVYACACTCTCVSVCVCAFMRAHECTCVSSCTVRTNLSSIERRSRQRRHRRWSPSESFAFTETASTVVTMMSV